ncbi:tetratricopeptide repeat protein [Nonomuraea guangzhouensis]|uniref:Tetratricopeptide repeat protein n=1 Tax=Nonomuraea guangzhouensis TaxID=1291555 RepID=A0ABW4FYT3_9ACTN
MLAPESDVRILGICGTSGIGKSFLLAEISRRAIDSGYRHAAIDLSSGATGDRPDSLDQSLLDDLVRTLLRLGSTSRRQQKLRHDRFTDQVRAAQKQLRLSHADIKIHMTASDGSTITGSPISHQGGHPAVDLYVAYRAALVDAALNAIADLRLSRVLLTVDGLEWLTRHDGLSAGTSREELLNWVTHKILPQLIEVAPDLRIITAGWERPSFPGALRAIADILYLEAWSRDETTAYLAGRGLDDPQLAALAHRQCSGTPIWLGMWADVYREGQQSGVDAGWMDGAQDSAIHDWLHRSFLHRLDPRQQKLVQAAAVLRHITLDGLRAVLAPTPVDNDAFGQLCRYSFVQRIPDRANHKTWLRIHGLVRAAFLADGHHSDTMTALHQAAATWYTAHNNPAEAAYHYFAIGDPAGLERWEELLDQALQRNDLSTARVLIDTATAPETGGFPRLRATGMASIIDLYQGRLACLDRALPEAARLLTRALRSSDRTTSQSRTAKAHRWRSAVYRLLGDYPRAEQATRKALDLYRIIGDPLGEAHTHRDLGILYRLWDNYPQAEQETRKAMELYRAIGDQWGETYAHGELGILYRLWDDYSPAERETRKALEDFEVIGDQLGEAYAHRDLGILYRLQDDYLRAERETRKALEQFQVTGNRFGEASAHREIGILYRLQDNYSQAEQETRRALKLYQAIGDQWGETYAHGELGILYRLQDDYPRAEYETGKVLKLYRTIGNRWGETYARRELGILYRLQGDYLRAEQETGEALELYRAIGNRISEPPARRELGILSRERDDYPRAEQETRKALELYQVIGNRWGDTHAGRELGILYPLQNDYSHAEQEARKALELYRAMGNRWGAANAHGELGILYRLQGDYLRAERETEEALEFYRAIGNRLGNAYSHGELGILYRLQGDYLRAERETEEALELYRVIGNRLGKANAHGELGTLHRLRNRYQEARDQYIAARTIYFDLGRLSDAKWCTNQID